VERGDDVTRLPSNGGLDSPLLSLLCFAAAPAVVVVAVVNVVVAGSAHRTATAVDRSIDQLVVHYRDIRHDEQRARKKTKEGESTGRIAFCDRVQVCWWTFRHYLRFIFLRMQGG
jgi:hypothetical protein